MIPGLQSLNSLLARAVAYWRFIRRERSVRRLELAIVLLLATVTVFAEAAGMTMILPILSYVEHGGDEAAFAGSSRLTRLVVDVFHYLGLGVSLLSLSAVALALIVLRQVLNFANSVEIERLKWKAGRRLTVRLFEAVLGSKANNIQAYKPGHFLNTAYNECQAAAAILRSYGTMWMQIVTLLVYAAILFVTAPVASLVAFAVILTAMLCLGALIRITNRLSRRSVAYRQDYTNFLAERFRAWKLIKLGNTLALERNKAEAIQDDVVANQISLLKVSGALALIFVPVISAFLLVTLYVFVEVLTLEVSVVMAFILILLRLMPVSQSIQAQINRLAQFFPSFEVVRSAFDQARAREEQLDRGKVIDGISEQIRFQGVSFAYSDREHHALRDVNVTIPARRMTAIVGPSGAGKSTFVDLIPRIIDPIEGSISIDDMPLDAVSLRSLRRLIAYVPQDPFLFDASVAENIGYLFPSASRAEIETAARLAHASAFIEAMPDGYETRMGDAGAKLSGGQKQRIVLAQAFLSRAPILILDEPTSALDYQSESAIQQSVERLVKERALTVIVIAHRLSTVRNADFVIHLQDGKVLRTGAAKQVLSQIGDADILLGADAAALAK